MEEGNTGAQWGGPTEFEDHTKENLESTEKTWNLKWSYDGFFNKENFESRLETH